MGRGGKGTPRADKPGLAPLPATFLQPDMIPKQTRDGHPMRQGYGVLPGGADTYIGYGEAWANVSNTPFREYKHWVHEGGISSPLIAHWPSGIKTAGNGPDGRGTLFREPAHLIDLMATAVDLAGAEYPKEFKGGPIEPMEGVSLRPAFSGRPLNRKEPIFFEHEGNRAVRDGRWKLVAKGRAGAWELYDFSADRTEMHDVAAGHPDKVAELSAKWEAWAARARVKPYPADAANKPGKKKK
jgi:arylsulfatase